MHDHIPFMFINGRTLVQPRLPRRITRSIAKVIAHHGRDLSEDGSQDPENTLEVQHPPEICRVLLVQHTKEHYAQ